MKNENAIEVNNLSKKYTKKDGSEFWALKDVSFNLKKGETLGIIGANGSGKSTLLKIMSDILKPSHGHAVLHGKVASILDIGTGFHPDLTGNENVFLSGTLMGMSKKEIELVYSELIDFSELSDFINEAVKTYSSGMYMRLAFSIFAYLKPEILILDEVFSVGDVAFQKKCNLKLKELLKKDITLVMVSHSIDEISNMCSRIIIIEKGMVIQDGHSFDITNFYLEQIHSINPFNSNYEPITSKIFNPPIGNNVLKLSKTYLKATKKETGDELYMEDQIELYFEYDKIDEGSVELVVFIFTAENYLIFSDSKAFRNDYKRDNTQKGKYLEKVTIPPNYFNRGLFFVSLAISTNQDLSQKSIDIDSFLSFKISLSDWDKKNKWSQVISSPLRPMLNWSIKKIS